MSEPDVTRWVGKSRLNLLRALPDHAREPFVQTAVKRYPENVGPAIQRLSELDGAAKVVGPRSG